MSCLISWRPLTRRSSTSSSDNNGKEQPNRTTSMSMPRYLANTCFLPARVLSFSARSLIPISTPMRFFPTNSIIWVRSWQSNWNQFQKPSIACRSARSISRLFTSSVLSQISLTSTKISNQFLINGAWTSWSRQRHHMILLSNTQDTRHLIVSHW